MAYSEKVDFDSRRDNRFDAGVTAGAGVEYRLTPLISLTAEVRHYYGLTNMYKNTTVGDPRYNTTWTFQAGCMIHLDKQDSVDNEVLENIYTNMYGTLLDHHMAIRVKNLNPLPSQADFGMALVIPGDIEVRKRSDYAPSPVYYNHVAKAISKLQEQGRATECCSWQTDDDFILVSCLIDSDILYFYLSSFDLTGHIGQNESEDNIMVNKVVDNYLNIVASSFIKHLPNGHLIGNRTYGGTCVLNGVYDADYSGTFGSSDGNHFVYLTTYLVLYGEERALYEGVGVTPDETVPYDKQLFKKTLEDNQLTAAINYIRAK